MQTKSLLASLAAVAVAGSAYAVSPYDTVYGIQWSYLNGGVNDERNGRLEASPDGTAWFVSGWSSYTGANFSMFGDQGNGGSWDSGYGQISARGAILQGKSLPNIGSSDPPFDTIQPGLTGKYTDENQSYTRQSLSLQGSSAVIGWDGNSNAYWDSEPLGSTPGGDFMTVKFDPDGSGPLTEGTSSYKTTTQFQSGANLRTQAAQVSQSSNTVWFAGGYQNTGDVITAGDNATGGLTASYSPWIGKKAPDGTLSGPAKQGNTDGRSYYNALSVNDSTSRVFAAGFSYDASGGVPSFWDVDGDGTADHTVPAGKTDPSFGILAIYDANTMAVVGSATMNSDYGDDWFLDVAATPDGGAVAVGRTKGSVAGYTNPASGTNDDIYVAKYDANGNLVWDWQSETAVEDEAASVSVDADGNIYVGSRVDVVRTNPANNTNAPVGSGSHAVTKFDAAGNLVWTNTLDQGGTLDDIHSASATMKEKVYVMAESNPVLGPTWSNINGYNPATGDDREILIQKLVPGDFDSDGDVDMVDVMTVNAATSGGPLAVDTYDFDTDGDSDFMDVTYFYLNVLDNLPGDTDGDGDIDDADLGNAFANYTGPAGAAGGKTALQGDTDGDGDVDDADLGNAFAAYTGPLASAVPEPTSLALLGLGGLAMLRRRRA